MVDRTRLILRLASWLLSFSIVLFHASAVLASLEDDARDLEAAIKADGGVVAARQTLFLEEAHVAAVKGPSGGRCRTIFVLTTRSVAFGVVAGSVDDDVDVLLGELSRGPGARAKESDSGLVQWGGCDAEVHALERVLVRMISARAAVEIRVATSDAPLPDLQERLGRAAGPGGSRSDPGPLLPVTSIAERRTRIETAARVEGAASVTPIEANSNETGTGTVSFRVPAGCHRFHLIAEPTDGHAVMDVDAELREKGGLRLAQDRGEIPDARLDACIARETDLALAFAGAPPKTNVLVIDVRFAIPEGLPARYGERARSAAAAALRRRVRRGPTTRPIFETMGVQGSMTTAMPVEAGRCYVAALALTRGSSRGLRLVASASSKASTDEASQGADGISVVFCADRNRMARLTADAPGAGLGWILWVWPLRERP